MRDKYFRIGSGTRLMSVVSFPSTGTPVWYDGYVEVGDMVDGIDYLIRDLNDYGKLSIFHNVEGEGMLDLACSFLGMSKVDGYRFSFPLKSENGHEYDDDGEDAYVTYKCCGAECLGRGCVRDEKLHGAKCLGRGCVRDEKLHGAKCLGRGCVRDGGVTGRIVIYKSTNKPLKFNNN